MSQTTPIPNRNTIVNMKTEVPNMGAAAVFFGLSENIDAARQAGQSQLIDSEVLPAVIRNKAVLEAWGVVFKEPDPNDPLFVFVDLPAGWSKRNNNESMYTDLVDERGHKRATICYKADFYDRDAWVGPTTRLHCGAVSLSTEQRWPYGFVKTSDNVEIFRTETIPLQAVYSRDSLQTFYAEYNEAENLVLAKVRAFLSENYPDYQSMQAYWDLDVEGGERPALAQKSEQGNG